MSTMMSEEDNLLPSVVAESSESWRRSLYPKVRFRGKACFDAMFPNGSTCIRDKFGYDNFMSGINAIINSCENQHPHLPRQPSQGALLALLTSDIDKKSQEMSDTQRAALKSLRGWLLESHFYRKSSLLLGETLYNLHLWGLQLGVNMDFCLYVPIGEEREHYITFDPDTTDEANTIFVWITHDMGIQYMGLMPTSQKEDDDAPGNELSQPSPLDDDYDGTTSQHSANEDEDHHDSSLSHFASPRDRVRGIVRGYTMKDVQLFFQGTSEINGATSLHIAIMDDQLYYVLRHLGNYYHEISGPRLGKSEAIRERVETLYAISKIIDLISSGFPGFPAGVESEDEMGCCIDIAKAFMRVFPDNI